MRKIKVAVGLSGGVDSAVSAYLLKKQGFDVSGVYLDCFDDDAPGCRGKQDRQDAVKVALHLKIPFQVLDFRRQYKSSVIGYFKKEYLAGHTPNPDVICNRDIKFGLLLDWCVKNGFDYLATGHYAALRHSERTPSERSESRGKSRNLGRLWRPIRIASLDSSARRQLLARNDNIYYSTGVYLVQPKDLYKDQTYFLWAVPRQNFARILFPLADFRKKDVRSLAKFAKIPVAAKPDSTGICFIGEVRVEDFLKRLGVKEKKGEVVVRMTIDDSRKLDDRRLKIEDSGGRLKVEDRKTKVKQSIFHPPSSTTIFHHPSSIVHFKVIGRHRGVWFYTIGQRHGFTVDNWPIIGSQFSVISPKSIGYQSAGLKPTNRKPTNHKQKTENRKQITDKPPLYIIEKDVENNRLIVGFGAETYREKFVVSNLNWLVDNKFFSQAQNSKFKTQNQAQNSKPQAMLVRIRHGGELIPCSLSANSEQLTDNSDSPFTIHRSRFTVHLRFALRGIAPGQSAVFYSKDGLVLGGGVIQ